MTRSPAFSLLTHRTFNLGDDIQSAAVMNLLGPGCFLDRDECQNWPATRIVMAGWWLESNMFPPPPHVEALPVGMHWQSGSVPLLARKEVVGWFQRQVEIWNAPVGARDQYTMEIFEKHGIPAIVTGCVTLTLPPYEGPRFGIVLIDCPLSLWDHNSHPSAKFTETNAITKTQLSDTLPACQPEIRMANALHRLSLLQRAELVVTSRLHVLLPCVAFRTPVVFLQGSYQPERWREYASLASGSFPLDGMADGSGIAEFLVFRNRPPQPVPDCAHRLREQLLKTRTKWNLSDDFHPCFE